MSDHTLEFHSTAPESPHGRVRENSMSMREIRESESENEQLSTRMWKRRDQARDDDGE